MTQRDIGDRLGLNKATVSLALRDSPMISPATRDRVKKAAAELGYRPDPALATLARQRWAGHETGSGAAIAYLVDSRMENLVGQRRFKEAANARADQRGYHLFEFDLAEYPSIDAACRVLYNRGIRGLLVPQFANTEGLGILDLPAEKFTIVCLDLGWVSVPFHIVGPDVFENTRMVWKKVVERGYKRIGGAVLAHVPQAVDDATRRAASLVSQLEWCEPENRIPLLLSDPLDRESFLKWIDEYKPDVVIGMVRRVYEWLTKSGWDVPGDIAFACLGLTSNDRDRISGAFRQELCIGSTGVDALIASMIENEWGLPTIQKKLLIEPVWNEGVTLPDRNSVVGKA